MNLIFNRNKLVLKDKLFSGLRFALQSLLPIFVFSIIVFLKLPTLAYALILLSKWRILATTPRFWWPNLQINAVDLIFSLSIVLFMSWSTIGLYQQLFWLFVYFFWVFALKSSKMPYRHTARGIITQALGSAALVYSVDQIYLPLLLFGIWLISILSVRHILANLPKEKYHKTLTHIWGIFSIQLAWVLLHWQVNFWVIPNLVFLQAIILSAGAILYILHQNGALPKFLRRQIIVSTLIITGVILFLSGVHSVSF